MIRTMLTTVDNPYDPFDDFQAWFTFDEQAGYHTTSYLGRLSFNSNELSESDQAMATEKLIDEIVMENITGVYRKVTREFP